MEEQFEVGIYFMDGGSINNGIAYLTEDELTALLSGESRRFIKYEKDYGVENKALFVNPAYIVDVWVETKDYFKEEQWKNK